VLNKYEINYIIKNNACVWKSEEKYEISQQPELFRTVPNPSTACYPVKTVPGVIKSLIRQFCATPAANSTQWRAGPAYEGPGAWGPENRV